MIQFVNYEYEMLQYFRHILHEFLDAKSVEQTSQKLAAVNKS